MTAYEDVKLMVANLKAAQASLEPFSMQTESATAKQLFTTAAKDTQKVIDSLLPRLDEMVKEEPTYH